MLNDLIDSVRANLSDLAGSVGEGAREKSLQLIEDWLYMAKRLYRLNSSGRIVLDYDLRIAEPFRVPGNEAGPDMWRALDALAGVPTLVVRGERSDILSARTAARMADRLPQGALVTVPGVGHPPTLDEPAAAAAIDALLSRIAEPASA